jgi:tetratricopeptide (TPR) repeat protein
VLHDLERPLTTGDFEAQKGQYAKILDKLKPLKLKTIDELEFDCRTKLFTALLRGGRQPACSDAAKEAARKELMLLLGEIWRAVGDDGRAGKLYAESGHTVPALKMLESSGEWQQAAALHRREGRPMEAAKMCEQHEDFAGALEAYREAGDQRSWLRLALKTSNVDEARKAARALPIKIAREVLFKARQGDLFLELLVEKGEWVEIGQLYERSEQWADAAQAFEKAGKLPRAAEAHSKGGDLISAARCLDREVQTRLAAQDSVGAGEVLRHAGQVERAVEIVAPQRPELAFKWLQKAGLDAKALEFAKARAKEHAAKPAEAAVWLEHAGELPLAAQAYLDGAQPAEALRVWESLRDWDHAAQAAAKAGQREHAMELFRRAGTPDPELRVQELAPELPPAPEPVAPGEASSS